MNQYKFILICLIVIGCGSGVLPYYLEKKLKKYNFVLPANVDKQRSDSIASQFYPFFPGGSKREASLNYHGSLYIDEDQLLFDSWYSGTEYEMPILNPFRVKYDSITRWSLSNGNKIISLYFHVDDVEYLFFIPSDSLVQNKIKQNISKFIEENK